MSPANILLVEDEVVLAMDLKGRLERLGHTVVQSVTMAQDALDAAERTRPDLVLMDIRTPGKLDGIGAAHQIREHHDTPVVFLTAYADRETLERAVEVGPFGYLVKPVEDLELHSTIEVTMAKAGTEREIQNQRDALSRRVNEVTALNGMFQRHLTESREVIDAYGRVKNKLTAMSADLDDLIKDAHAVVIPDAPDFA